MENLFDAGYIQNLVRKIQSLVQANQKPIVFSVANQKGGVGKTTTVDNLAELFASFGLKTAIIDIDPQSSITTLKNDITEIIENHQPEMTDVMLQDTSLKSIITQLKPNLYIAPTTLKLSDAELNLVNATLRELILKRNIEELNSEFDIIIIDCPPSRGLLTVNALSASDFVIVPVQSEYQALVSINLLFSTINNVQKAINPDLKVLGYVITMATRTNHSDEIIKEVEIDNRANIIGIINRQIVISDAGVANMSAYEFDRGLTASQQYFKLACDVLEKALKEMN